MDTEHQKIRSEKNTKRVCQFCLKEFSSGKALGGHMRIHIQKKKKKKYSYGGDSSADTNSKKPYCMICGHDFPSWKSLYGHMRCHPGRGWKGINPPPFSSSSSTMSSSSSLSDTTRDECRRSRSSGETKDTAAPVDLMASLNGWPVTAERGRKATGTAAVVNAASSEVSSSSVCQELLAAVDYLTMLSRAEEKLVGSDIRGADPNENNEHEEVVHEELPVEKTEHDRNRKRRKKKKVKLTDLELTERIVGPSTPVVDKYKCDVCDRSFSSHQAYGGHRSRHNKVKIMNINTNESSRLDPSCRSKPLSSQVVLPVQASSPVCRRGFEFDLNEVPPITDQFEPRLDFFPC